MITSDVVFVMGAWLAFASFADELLHGVHCVAALIGGFMAIGAWMWRCP